MRPTLIFAIIAIISIMFDIDQETGSSNYFLVWFYERKINLFTLKLNVFTLNLKTAMFVLTFCFHESTCRGHAALIELPKKRDFQPLLSAG